MRRIADMSRAARAADRLPATVDVHVGARLRQRRKYLGMTQQQLASELGLTFQQIQKYERGANRVSASKLYELARALGVTISYFFEGLPDPGRGDGGLQAPPTGPEIQAFLLTSEGLELVSLFPRLPRSRLRRLILELVRVAAEEAESDR
jgi:transcriptional regulator with XRE-family HTH domain